MRAHGGSGRDTHRELSIRELKTEGLAQTPSGMFSATGAWLVLATSDQDLARWTARLGYLDDGVLFAKTIRRRYLVMPSRLTASRQRWRLALPDRCS